MARPEGAQALRAIQKDLDEGRSLPGINYIPLSGIGEGLGEWFEASSYGKKRLEMLRTCRGIPASIQDKQIIASKFGELQNFPYLCLQKDKVMISTIESQTKEEQNKSKSEDITKTAGYKEAMDDIKHGRVTEYASLKDFYKEMGL